MWYSDCHFHATATATNRHRVIYAAEDGIKLPTKYIEADGSCPEWSRSPETSHEVYDACATLICTPKRIYETLHSYLIEAAQHGCIYADVLSSCMNRWNSFEATAAATLRAMEDAYREMGIESGLAVTFKRHHHTGVEGAHKLLGNMLNFKNKGLDIHDRMYGTHMAGSEKDQSPAIFRPVYEIIAREFGPINNGIHAGETTGPPDIWAALSLPGVTRIGHGLSAVEDPALMDYLRDHDILMEQLLTSNEMQLKRTPKTHPIPIFVRHGVAVGLGTDDPKLQNVIPGVDGVTIDYEYARAAIYGLNEKARFAATVDNVRHGFSASWRLQKVLDRLAIVNAKHNMGIDETRFKLMPQPVKPASANLPQGWPNTAPAPAH